MNKSVKLNWICSCCDIACAHFIFKLSIRLSLTIRDGIRSSRFSSSSSVSSCCLISHMSETTMRMISLIHFLELILVEAILNFTVDLRSDVGLMLLNSSILRFHSELNWLLVALSAEIWLFLFLLLLLILFFKCSIVRVLMISTFLGIISIIAVSCIHSVTGIIG
jgi:hypothetical protein